MEGEDIIKAHRRAAEVNPRSALWRPSSGATTTTTTKRKSYKLRQPKAPSTSRTTLADAWKCTDVSLTTAAAT